MPMADVIASEAPKRTTHSKIKEWALKFILLTAFTMALGLAQGWAASRTYQSDYPAGFHTGVLHGILMPAALPGLLLGQNLKIYAPNNSGRPYNIGYILGINGCGTVFFGIAFWQRQAKQKRT